MSVETLRGVVTRPLRRLRRYQARSAVRVLASHEDQTMRAVGLALLATLEGGLSVDERAVIASIEDRRSALAASQVELSVIDFGAGDPESDRTKDQMAEGVRSTIPISRVCSASKPEFWATFLFHLVRRIAPASCIELGSCVGISAAYQGAALRFNGKGRLVTLEGSPEIAKLAAETLEGLQLDNAAVVTGPFHRTLAGVLESAAPIDYLFNDGHHDHGAVLEYFEAALPKFADEAIMVVDDISWSRGMASAWRELQAHPRVGASVDLETLGIVLITGPVPGETRVRIPMRRAA